MLNDRDPELHICMVQSDSLISKYVMGAWLQCLYVSNRTFSRNILLLEFVVVVVVVLGGSARILHSPFYQQGSRRCADGAERKSNETETGQSDTQTS